MKFRVWDKQNNKFVLNTNNNTIYFDLFDWAALHDSNLKYKWWSYTFQQYTGLTDKNGREIYEGDIVLWNEYQGWEDGRTFVWRYEVKWNQNDLRFDFHEIHEDSWWPLADTKFDYVIGNIFENSNLLKNE